jgi:phage/plasmid-associated DNA primase
MDAYDFLNKVFPDSELREYFMDTTCTSFRGGNPYKQVLFWSADGDNAKSVTEKIVKTMLGPYCSTLPTSLLTGRTGQSSSATPELQRCGGGVRVIIMQEPSASESINVGMLKQLSGNDIMYSRGLYKEGEEIAPMFKVIIVCNSAPIMPNGGDVAIWNRITVLPFESKFVNKALLPSTEAEQWERKLFLMDPTFEVKIPRLRQAFAWIFLQRLKKTNGVVGEAPAKVRAATRRYKDRNNIIRQFLSDMTVECKSDANGNMDDDDEASGVGLTDLFKDYKTWIKDNTANPKDFAFGRLDFMDKVSEEWKELTDDNGIWQGHKFKGGRMRSSSI